MQLRRYVGGVEDTVSRTIGIGEPWPEGSDLGKPCSGRMTSSRNTSSDAAACSLAKGLAFLRAIDAVETDRFNVVVVQGFDGVAVEDRNRLTRQPRGLGSTGEPKRDRTPHP